MEKKKLFLLRLYNLKKGSQIHGLDVKFKGNKKNEKVIVQFDHVDGMFSYNYVLDKDGNKIKVSNELVIVHLANTTILKKIDDHYKIADEEEIKNFKD